MSGSIAADPLAGVTATLERGDVTVSVHYNGVQRDALRALAAHCDAEGWRVRTVSTVATIYRDLRGTRGYTRRAAKKGASWFHADPPENAVSLPEYDLLGKIGRKDLLA